MLGAASSASTAMMPHHDHQLDHREAGGDAAPPGGRGRAARRTERDGGSSGRRQATGRRLSCDRAPRAARGRGATNGSIGAANACLRPFRIRLVEGGAQPLADRRQLVDHRLGPVEVGAPPLQRPAARRIRGDVAQVRGLVGELDQRARAGSCAAHARSAARLRSGLSSVLSSVTSRTAAATVAPNSAPDLLEGRVGVLDRVVEHRGDQRPRVDDPPSTARVRARAIGWLM
jgi:hypothetical protein